MIKPTSPGIVPATATRSRTVAAMAAFPALFPATFALKSAQAPPSTWRSAPLMKLAASDANECDRVGDLLQPASLACQVECDRQERRKDGSCRRPAQQPTPAGRFQTDVRVPIDPIALLRPRADPVPPKQVPKVGCLFLRPAFPSRGISE